MQCMYECMHACKLGLIAVVQQARPLERVAITLSGIVQYSILCTYVVHLYPLTHLHSSTSA
jgi:hypothetical protein